jgi:hypothetical protein
MTSKPCHPAVLRQEMARMDLESLAAFRKALGRSGLPPSSSEENSVRAMGVASKTAIEWVGY